MRMALLNKSYKFPNQLQQYTMQCGVACLEMICKYYKKKYSANCSPFFATVYDSDWNEPHSPARKVKCTALVNSRLSRQGYALYTTAVYALMVDPVFPSDEQIQLSS